MKGKPLNVSSAGIERAMENKEMKSFLNVIGCGITGFGLEVDKARYGKIILLADADPDGMQIMALLLATCGKYLRELVAEGMIYIVELPLYSQNGVFIAPGDEHLLDSKKPYNRFKGLGEMDAVDLKHTAISESRKLIRVTQEGLDEAIRLAASPMPKKKLMKDYGIIR